MQYHFKGFPEDYALLDSILSCSEEYALIATDPKEQVLMWSRSAEKLMGYTSNEILGTPCPILHDHEFSGKNSCSDCENNDSGATSFPANAKAKQGHYIPVDVTVSAMRTDSGVLLGFIIIARDTTKENLQQKLNKVLIDITRLVNRNKKQDDMLLEILKLIQDFLEIPAVSICLHDKLTKSLHLYSQNLQNNSDTFSSSACCYPITKMCCGGALSENCMEAYIKRKICKEEFTMTVTSGKNTYQIPFKEKMYLYHIPVLSETTLLGILHVMIPKRLENLYLEETQALNLISEEICAGLKRKSLEEELQRNADDLEKIVRKRTDELREKDAQLIQSEKLATLGEMAAGIAHEINQPLGVISLIAQGLKKSADLGKLTEPLLHDKLNSIQAQIDRINIIIQHLRVFSRNDPKTKELIDINKPLKEIFHLIGRQLTNHSISVELHLDSNLMVMADNNRLEQVFLNIIGNARDALDDHEETVLQFRQMENSPLWVQNWEKKIVIRSYRLTNRVIVEIEDTGGGIPKHIADRIFDPFFTTKEVGRGTGLGLYISYGIIKDFGGEIKANTKSGTGAVFSVILPAAPG